MTTDSGASNKPEKASALLSMFEPPASEVPNSNTRSKDSGMVSTSTKLETTSSTRREDTSALVGMFDPPPSTDTQTPRTTPTIDEKVRESLNGTPPRAAPLMAMFEPPVSSSSPNNRSSFVSRASPEGPLVPPPNAIQAGDRQSTIRQSNLGWKQQDQAITEHTNLLQSLFAEDEKTPKVSKKATTALFQYHATNADGPAESTMAKLFAPALGSPQKEDYQYIPVKLPEEDPNNDKHTNQHTGFSIGNFTSITWWKEFAKTHFQPSTWAGAVMFCLYHLVFCLANASAMDRPHSDQPILGLMAKLTTVGILFAGPFYIWRLGPDVPALYPSVDLFLAPFLAAAAAVVDQTLADDGMADDTDTFLASFAVLAAIGMFAAGSLLLLAATFKLANLGTFLPYSVLCGFFSAVGVLLWALAFSVDNNSKTWQHVFFSGDWPLIQNCLLHHLPSLTVGILMNILAPKHPFYTIFLLILTIVSFYFTMWVTGTSLEEAQEQQWFWSRDELSIQSIDAGSLLQAWKPPVPFGHWSAILFLGQVNWKAVSNGLQNMFTLAFLYLLRSSIHASAMKKNVNNLVCKKRVKKEQPATSSTITHPKNTQTMASNMKRPGHHRKTSSVVVAMEAISDNVRMVNEALDGTQISSGANQSIRPMKSPNMGRRPNKNTRIELPSAKEDEDTLDEIIEIRPKPCHRSLQDIFVDYGSALILVSFSGGFGVCPTVATSNTMYAIGAGGPAPQYVSILLLIVFYATDFTLVRYIPKACFSSLLVLGAVDTFVVWFVLAYKKTQDLSEWLVVPFIVAFSVIVGFLNAVFLGIGISTFVFVASFFRVGVVKFNASGLEIRSTIERSIGISDWLDQHGDYIQVLVLQNYLFFGNASSILNYIATMFEEVDQTASNSSSFDLPPFPKVLVIDMSLITGMDTSTLDIFAEIKELCKNNKCKLYLCGLSSRAKKGLSLTGVKAETGFRDQRLVRFFSDLDTALGIAEDYIASELYEKELDTTVASSRSALFDGSPTKNGRSGFQTALKLIDEQHGQEFSKGLLELEPYTDFIELHSGDKLFACDGGVVENRDRGLFFIESGTLKIERDAGATLTRGRNTLNRSRGGPSSYGTLNNLHARSGTLGRQRAAIKATTRDPMTRTFRLARIGPGWVCGIIEGTSGMAREGVHVAVTQCRLHHISYQKLEEIEQNHPRLILALYKMLSHLMARRQEITIEQLATFHSIMSSPAHSKPVSRAAIQALTGR